MLFQFSHIESDFFVNTDHVQYVQIGANAASIYLAGGQTITCPRQAAIDLVELMSPERSFMAQQKKAMEEVFRQG